MRFASETDREFSLNPNLMKTTDMRGSQVVFQQAEIKFNYLTQQPTLVNS